MGPYAVILAYMIHIYDDRPAYRDYNIIMFFAVIAAVCAVFLFTGIGGFDKDEMLKNISLLGCTLAIPVMRAYNGKHDTAGRLSSKAAEWSFYIAYPLLLVILSSVKFALAGQS